MWEFMYLFFNILEQVLFEIKCIAPEIILVQLDLSWSVMFLTGFCLSSVGSEIPGLKLIFPYSLHYHHPTYKMTRLHHDALENDILVIYEKTCEENPFNISSICFFYI